MPPLPRAHHLSKISLVATGHKGPATWGRVEQGEFREIPGQSRLQVLS